MSAEPPPVQPIEQCLLHGDDVRLFPIAAGIVRPWLGQQGAAEVEAEMVEDAGEQGGAAAMHAEDQHDRAGSLHTACSFRCVLEPIPKRGARNKPAALPTPTQQSFASGAWA